MKRFVEGVDRGQSTLFPSSLDDYVSEDNPVRAVDVFVDGLDLGKLGFVGVQPLDTGRPSYHPSTMLKLYIYGYLNRVPSSRRLERECQRNIEMIWLTGQLAPDFKTIADFRKDNGKAIREVCREFVALCRKLDLLVAASVAIDGSKFKAVNARDKNFTEAKMKRRLERIDESINRYLSQLETADRHGDAVPEAKVERLKGKIEKLKEEIVQLNAINAEMMKSEDKQISQTDPDARSMATSGKDTGIVGYNVQIAVDTRHHRGSRGDQRGHRSPPTRQRGQAGSRRDGCRDARSGGRPRLLRWRGDQGLRGSRHHSDVAEADDFGRQGCWPPRQTGFRLCPRRRCLSLSRRRAANLSLYERRGREDTAPLLDKRLQNLRAKSSVHDRPRTPHLTLGARGRSGESSGSARHNPNAMGVRRQTAEHPFGTMKCWMGATHFLTKKLPKVAAEMALNVLAYNMKRVMMIVGVGGLLEAMRA